MKVHRFFILVLLIGALAFLLGCPKKETNPPPAGNPTLKVWVYDPQQLPISGAVVQTGSTSVTTNGDGYAGLVLTAGSYSLTISAANYSTSTRTAVIGASTPVVAVVNLLRTSDEVTHITAGAADTVTSPDSSVIVEIPAGTITTSTDMTVSPLPSNMFGALPAPIPDWDSMMTMPLAAVFVELNQGSANPRSFRIRMRNDQPVRFAPGTTGIQYAVYTDAGGWEKIGPAEVSADSQWFQLPAGFLRTHHTLDAGNFWGAYVIQQVTTWVSGFVKERNDSLHNPGIAGALVTIPSLGRNVYTESSGYFYLNIPAIGGTAGHPMVGGSCGIEVYKDGYIPYPLEFGVAGIPEEIGMAAHYYSDSIFLSPIAGYNGPKGSIRVRVISAVNSQAISNAEVTLMEMTQHKYTNDTGYVVFDSIPTGSFRIRAAASGFQTTIRTNVVVARNELTEVSIPLSVDLRPGEFRIVLTWGEHPLDLDSHVKCPPQPPDTAALNGYEIRYDNKGSQIDTIYPFAFLDHDSTQGYGPETVTFFKFIAGTYHYVVYQWSSGPSMVDSSQATVQVFNSGGLIYTFRIPPGSSTARWWHVLDIQGPNGRITPFNTLYESAPFGMSPSLYGKTNVAKSR